MLSLNLNEYLLGELGFVPGTPVPYKFLISLSKGLFLGMVSAASLTASSHHWFSCFPRQVPLSRAMGSPVCLQEYCRRIDHYR